MKEIYIVLENVGSSYAWAGGSSYDVRFVTCDINLAYNYIKKQDDLEFRKGELDNWYIEVHILDEDSKTLPRTINIKEEECK